MAQSDSDVITDDDGVEWVKLKEAADRTGQKQRNIRLWADTDKIRSKRFEDRANAPVYVALADVEEIAQDRPAEKKDVLPIPVAAFEQLQELTKRVIDEHGARVKAETVAEFQTERVQLLLSENEQLKAKLAGEAEEENAPVIDLRDQVAPVVVDDAERKGFWSRVFG